MGYTNTNQRYIPTKTPPPPPPPNIPSWVGPVTTAANNAVQQAARNVSTPTPAVTPPTTPVTTTTPPATPPVSTTPYIPSWGVTPTPTITPLPSSGATQGVNPVSGLTKTAVQLIGGSTKPQTQPVVSRSDFYKAGITQMYKGSDGKVYYGEPESDGSDPVVVYDEYGNLVDLETGDILQQGAYQELVAERDKSDELTDYSKTPSSSLAPNLKWSWDNSVSSWIPTEYTPESEPLTMQIWDNGTIKTVPYTLDGEGNKVGIDGNILQRGPNWVPPDSSTWTTGTYQGRNVRGLATSTDGGAFQFDPNNLEYLLDEGQSGTQVINGAELAWDPSIGEYSRFTGNIPGTQLAEGAAQTIQDGGTTKTWSPTAPRYDNNGNVIGYGDYVISGTDPNYIDPTVKAQLDAEQARWNAEHPNLGTIGSWLGSGGQEPSRADYDSWPADRKQAYANSIAIGAIAPPFWWNARGSSVGQTYSRTPPWAGGGFRQY